MAVPRKACGALALLALLLFVSSAFAQEEANDAAAQLAACNQQLESAKATVQQWQTYSETMKKDAEAKQAEAAQCGTEAQALKAAAEAAKKDAGAKEAEVAKLSAQVQELQAAVAAGKSDTSKAAQAQTDAEAKLSAAKAELATKVAAAQADAQGAKAEAKALSTKLAEAQASLKAAQDALAQAKAQASASKVDSAAVVDFLKSSAKSFATSAADEAQLLFADLKVGNMSRATKLAVKSAEVCASWGKAAYAAASSLGKATYDLLAKEADEHLPENVKAQARQLFAQASELWKKHVVEAAWAKVALMHLSTANNEIKALLTAFLKKQAVTRDLADPVTVQLIVYMIIGLPISLLLLLPLLLLLASSPRAPPAGAQDSKGKKKSKAGGKGARRV